MTSTYPSPGQYHNNQQIIVEKVLFATQIQNDNIREPDNDNIREKSLGYN